MNATMTLDEYVAECKSLFDAARYGWSVWEQEIAELGWSEGDDPQEAVYRMNDCYVRRLANRNV